MRSLITTTLLAFAALSANAQTINETFLNPQAIFSAGWAQQNLSSPIGTSAWFTGNTTVFPANSAPDSSYIGSNFNCGAGTATLSNWLFSPTRTYNNGDVVSFFTRANVGTPTYPDRLEVRLSTAGTGTNVGTTATSVGTYTTLLLTINPTLTTTGYPGVWTQYTATISGLVGPTSGRVAFRYFVTNGGPSGANSDYIGIDNVNIYTPVSSDIQVLTADTLEYTSVPQRQLDGQPFNSTLRNNGVSPLSNVYLNVRVRNGIGTVVYTANSTTLPTLAAGASANFSVAGTTALTPDSYSIEYIAKHSTADGVPTNDTLRNYIFVDSEMYARDNGNVIGALGIGAGNGGYIGQMFRLYQPDIIDSVNMYVTEGYTGRPYGLAIWNTVGGIPNAIVATTDTLLYPDNLAHYFTLRVRNGGVGLAAGTYFVSAIEFDSTLSLGRTNAIYTPNRMYVNWPTNPNGTWTTSETFNFPQPYVIRPDLVFPTANIGSITTTPAGCGVGGTASVPILGVSSQGATYLWSNGQTTATATNLPAGAVSVTVTLYGVKVLTASGTVGNSGGAAPNISSVGSTQINCFGGTSTLSPSVSGGTPGYSYLWSNGATIANPVVPAGTYTLTVTDASSCTSVSQPVVVTQPTQLLASPTSSGPACNGGTATLNANASGGTTAYSYLWSNGSTTATANGPAGTYTVTVTDFRGCTTTGTVTAIAPSPVSVNVAGGTINCAGGTATLGASASGGTPGYSYTWSNASTTSSIQAPAGTYTVTATDANGCTAVSSSVTLNQPSAITVTTTPGTILCNTGSTTVSASVTGGAPGYSYVWSTGSTASSITAGAGTYTLTVTDANGCTSSPSPTVLQQPSAIIVNVNSGIIACNGGTTTLTALPTGGTPGYTYTWSNGGTAAATTAGPGTYIVTVTDANGCQAFSTATTLANPAPVTVTPNATTVACAGGSSTVSATAAGGTGAFTYVWSNGATASTFTTGSAGSYSVTATDANGCQASGGPVTVTIPAALSLTTSNTPASSLTANDGAASTLVSGGTPGYSYIWSNGGTTPTITGLGPGTYSVTVTDANGCTSVGVTNVLTGLDANGPIHMLIISPNPNQGTFTMQANASYPLDMTLRVHDAAGRLVLTRQAGQTDAWTEQVTLDGADGVYLLELSAGDNRRTARVVVQR